MLDTLSESFPLENNFWRARWDLNRVFSLGSQCPTELCYNRFGVLLGLRFHIGFVVVVILS